MSTTQKDVRLDQITVDGSCQLRADIDDEAAEDYAQAMKDGDVFPAVGLVFDGETYWPWDGHDRIKAHQINKRAMIAAEVTEGTKQDAIVLAAGANQTHGRRRTSADKRKAIKALLTIKEWAEASDRVIAARVGVDNKTVAACREAACEEIPHTTKTRVDKHGTSRPATQPPKNEPAKPIHCDRCQRVSPVKDCPKCAELQAKAGKKAKAKPGGKTPKVGEDLGAVWKPHEDLLGKLIRSNEQIAANYKVKGSPEYKQAFGLLNDYAGLVKAWKKHLAKMK